LLNAQSGPANNDGAKPDGDMDVHPVKTGGTGNTVIADNKPAMPHVWVEQMPVFEGDLNTFLSRNLRYPDAARENGIEGRVIIKFVVNEDGSVSNAMVERGIGGGCDEEALRIIRSMPKWKPGKQNGMPVKVFFTQAIKFVLSR
jgi:protein TonB